MLAVTLLVSTLGALAAARVYERCELARDLLALGVQRERVATWVCIAYHESRFDTSARNHGSGDHGLLQISELYWCGPGKVCGAPCSAFRDDDISDDVHCALQIHAEHTRLQGDGFLAWVVYPHHCMQNAKKFIVDCDKNIYKNIPAKVESRARSFKPYDVRSESKPRFVSYPYSKPATPRYLTINSIFQGALVNEFENYENLKQSNWLNFKVDNIDALEIPANVPEVQRPRYEELATRRTSVTKLDLDLIGIKPPSPRKIESNQFRRRKTFSQPQLLYKKNSITVHRENSQTTDAPSRVASEVSLSVNEDISQNIFLNLQTSVLSKSLKEFSSPEIKSTELRHQVKNSRKEKNSPVLTVNDLAENPFLSSVLRSNFNNRADSTSGFAYFDQNNFRGYTLTTSRPEASFRSSIETDCLRCPEVNLKLPKSSKSHFLVTSEDTNVSVAILAQNPFLSHIFQSKEAQKLIGKSRFEENQSSKENYKKIFIAKPTDSITVLKQPSTENYTAHQDHLEISTRKPQKLMRSRARYLLDFDKTTNVSPVTNVTPVSESPTTVAYSTRRYHTINRQKTTSKQDNSKSTRAILPITENPTVSSIEPIQSTLSSIAPFQTTHSTARPTLSSTALTQMMLSSTASTRLTLSSTAPTQPTLSSTASTQPTLSSTAPTEPTLSLTASAQPTLSSFAKTQLKLLSTKVTHQSLFATASTQPMLFSTAPTQVKLSSSAPNQVTLSSSAPTQLTLSSTAPTKLTVFSTAPKQDKSVKIKTTTSKTATSLSTTLHNVTGRNEITSKILSTRTTYTQRPAANITETRSISHSKGIPLTTRPLQTVTRTDTASKWQMPRSSPTGFTYPTSRPQESRKLLTTDRTQNIRRSDRNMETIGRVPTTSATFKSDTTPRLPATSSTWPYRRSKEELHSKSWPITTPRSSSNYSWRRPASQRSSTVTYIDNTENLLSTSANGSPSKTTFSIFDLYLRPSTRAPLKPLEFTSSSRLRKGISIFSDGTTKPPPSYYSNKTFTLEEVRQTNT